MLEDERMLFLVQKIFLLFELIPKSLEFFKPGFRDDFAVHGSFKSVFSELFILLFIFESSDGSFNSKFEFTLSVLFEYESATFLGFWFEFDYGIFETSSFKCYNWCFTDKEFVLYNAAWFESGWHETEIGTSVDKGTIDKELIWSGPETIWIFFLKILHLKSTLGSIWIFWVSWSSDKELNSIFESQN